MCSSADVVHLLSMRVTSGVWQSPRAQCWPSTPSRLHIKTQSSFDIMLLVSCRSSHALGLYRYACSRTMRLWCPQPAFLCGSSRNVFQCVLHCSSCPFRDSRISLSTLCSLAVVWLTARVSAFEVKGHSRWWTSPPLSIPISRSTAFLLQRSFLLKSYRAFATANGIDGACPGGRI